MDDDGKSRVLKSFDFSNIREVVSLDNLSLDEDKAKARAERLLKKKNATPAEIAEAIMHGK